MCGESQLVGSIRLMTSAATFRLNVTSKPRNAELNMERRSTPH